MMNALILLLVSPFCGSCATLVAVECAGVVAEMHDHAVPDRRSHRPSSPCRGRAPGVFPCPSPQADEFAPGEAFVLVGDADPVGRAVERAGERGAREIGRVVLLATDARRRGASAASCRDAPAAPPRPSLSRWPKLAGDALLQRIRVVAVGQHVEVVIAFEHQRVAARQARLDVRASRRRGRSARRAATAPSPNRRTAPARARRAAPETAAPRWRRSRNASWLSKPYTLRQPGEALGDGGQRAERQPHRRAVARGERRHAADMIAVLVRDEDRGDRSPASRPSRARRATVSRMPKPQSISTRVPPASTTRPLPSLPLPREAKRTSGLTRGHFSWSLSSARIFSLVGGACRARRSGPAR